MRKRTSKWIANRTDETYIRRGSPIARWRLGATLLCSAMAIGWIEASYFRKTQTMYNPGPVAPVHAMFEEKCTVCHDGVGGGKGFFRTVSDNACLKCHDGSIHHPNQISLISSDGQHAARCTTCHVEHHGQEALAGTSDALCVRCHGDLSRHTKGKRAPNEIAVPDWAPKITAFDNGTHPKFGRRLMEGDKLVDTTRLRFNHKKHVPLVKPLAGQTENCSVCHRTNDSRMVPGSNAIRVPLAPDPQLFLSVNESNEVIVAPEAASTRAMRVESVNVSDGLYMLPVSFERDCAACHYIRLPGPYSDQTLLPHEALDLIRPKVADLTAIYRPVLSKLIQSYPPKKREAELVEEGAVSEPAHAAGPRSAFGKKESPSPAPSHSGPPSAFAKPPAPAAAGSGPPSAFKKPTPPVAKKAITEDQWIARMLPRTLEEFKIKLAKWSAKKSDLPGRQGLSDAIASLRGKDDATAQWSALEDALAYNRDLKDSSCILCHDMAGSAPALYEQQLRAMPSPTTQPLPMIEPLHTLPTGIPPSSRRWFTESRFSHRAHQNIICTSCHVDATASTQTSDVLSPNQTWQEAGKTVSCADCHHAPNSIDRGAGSNCVTCHIFHDRGNEGLPGKIHTIDAILHGPATKPDVMTASSTPKPDVPPN